MTTIPISVARQTLPSLIDRVYRGEQLTIAKNNIPVAMLIPVTRVDATKKRSLVRAALALYSHRKEKAPQLAASLRAQAWK